VEQSKNENRSVPNISGATPLAWELGLIGKIHMALKSHRARFGSQSYVQNGWSVDMAGRVYKIVGHGSLPLSCPITVTYFRLAN